MMKKNTFIHLFKTTLCLWVIILLANPHQVFAQLEQIKLAEAEQWSSQAASNIHFSENKGQIVQTNGQSAPFVAFMLQRGNTNIYLLKAGGIAYQFNKMHYPEGYQDLQRDKHLDIDNREQIQKMEADIRLETYRMDMHLVGANPESVIITEGKSADYTQYYTHDALFVHHFQKVTYKDVYPGIDWVIYTKPDGGIKYDFVVHPGANPQQIQLRFTDQEELYIDHNGNLIHGNRMGRFTEKTPISYQNKTPIATRFILNNDIVTFEIAHYNPEMPLTIDPDRIWGTYYGGTADDRGYACAVDPNGNVYIAGFTSSTGGIATAGGHSTTNGGSRDAFLVKFNASGVRQWATYYGGDRTDEAWSCATDASGNVYLAGRTLSTNNIASSSNSHQPTNGGGDDAFLVKFNASGVRQWATFYGGSGTDWGRSCATDASGNVYLAGYTLSTNNIASSSNSHQPTYGGGDDAFLVKFNASGVRQWATYYGGSGTDWGRSCATDASGNVYLAGWTASANNIASSSNSHQPTNGGGRDAFLVKFNASGVRQWATYYGGSNWDEAWSCATDASGNVYLAGYTESTNNISTPSTSHQSTNGGGRDAFLVKFNASGVRQWATYYGGSNTDDGYSCATDALGNVYLAGHTTSTNNIASSSNSHQPTNGGSSDAFLVKFNASGVRQWATYYGGSNYDYGLSCGTDASGNMYLAGYTASANNIASEGARQTTNAGGEDAFLVKFKGHNCTVDGPYVRTLCMGTNLNPPINHLSTNATGIASPIGLPPGITALYSSNGIISLSGSPEKSGVFNYSIPLTGICDDLKAIGRITVNENTVKLSSAAGSNNQTVLPNTPITNILYTTTGATGIGAPINLPQGVSAAFVSNVISISGVPTVEGSYNYRIPLTGGCGEAFATGTITVTSTTNVDAINGNKASWTIFPNPNSGHFTIASSAGGLFELMDVSGKTINSYSLEKVSSMAIAENLTGGIYFIRNANSGQVQKIVIH